MLLRARAGDIIWYFKRDDKKKGGVSTNPLEIGIYKYKEMLMSTVNDALEILCNGSAEKIGSEIFGITQKSKKKSNAVKRNDYERLTH